MDLQRVLAPLLRLLEKRQTACRHQVLSRVAALLPNVCDSSHCGKDGAVILRRQWVSTTGIQVSGQTEPPLHGARSSKTCSAPRETFVTRYFLIVDFKDSKDTPLWKNWWKERGRYL